MSTSTKIALIIGLGAAAYFVFKRGASLSANVGGENLNVHSRDLKLKYQIYAFCTWVQCPFTLYQSWVRLKFLLTTARKKLELP